MGIQMFKKLIFIMFLGAAVHASELNHEFKNPAFSGNGYSTHVLSIEQLRYSRKNDVKEEQRRIEGQKKREEEKSPSPTLKLRGNRQIAGSHYHTPLRRGFLLPPLTGPSFGRSLFL